MEEAAREALKRVPYSTEEEAQLLCDAIEEYLEKEQLQQLQHMMQWSQDKKIKSLLEEWERCCIR